MSGRAFLSFQDVARALSSRPTLPLPTRTRLLRELGADLDDLTRLLIDGGVEPEEARRRAADAVLPDERTLRELETIGRPWYRRITAGLDPTWLTRVERTGLIVSTLAILTVAAWGLVGAGPLRDPSPFLLPVLASGTALLASVAGKAFQLWVKGAHERLRHGLTAIAALSATTLGIGVAGGLIDLTLLAGTLEREPTASVELATRWLVQDATLLSTAIILAVAGALGWFALSRWVTHAEHAHHQASIGGRATARAPGPGSTHDSPAMLDRPSTTRHDPRTTRENRS